MEIYKYLLKGIGIIYLGIFGGVAANYFVSKDFNSTPVQIVTKEVYIDEDTALTDLVKELKDCVIGIKTGKVTGSGLIITSDGLAVSLVDNMPQGIESNIFSQTKSNTAYQVLKRDFNNDLALIKLDDDNAKTNGFFDLSNLKIGLKVFVISQIYDIQKGNFLLAADGGIVKSFDDDIIRTNILNMDNINGSPVFDVDRRIVGLTVKDSNNFVNIIPISKIREFAGL